MVCISLSKPVVGPIVAMFVVFLCSGFRSPLSHLLYFITVFLTNGTNGSKVWSRCWSYSLFLCGLFYERFVLVLPYAILSLCFSVLLALWLPRLGKNQLILVLFVRLFDLRLFGFVCFLFLLVFGKGCCLWFWRSLDFSLNFIWWHVFHCDISQSR